MNHCRPRGSTAMLAAALAVLALTACESSSTPEASTDAAPTADAPTADASAELPDFSGDPDSLPRFVHYIRGDVYPRLVLELDKVDGHGPEDGVEADLTAGLSQLLDKPAGVEVVHDGLIPSKGADHAWTFSELSALAKQTFDLAVPDDTIKMHIVFLDGRYAEDTDSFKILGLAWASTHLVVFKDTIESLCQGGLAGPLSQTLRARLCASTELGIWTHEVGHLLGLVGNGLPLTTDHQDHDHGAHDTDDGCIMYYAYQGQALVDLFRTRLLAGGEPDLGFDAACLADIAAVRDAP